MQRRNVPFSQSLRAWRKFRNLTQSALAQSAEISSNAVYMLEAGLRNDPPWSSVLALARALKIRPDNFLHNPPKNKASNR